MNIPIDSDVLVFINCLCINVTYYNEKMKNAVKKKDLTILHPVKKNPRRNSRIS